MRGESLYLKETTNLYLTLDINKSNSPPHKLDSLVSKIVDFTFILVYRYAHEIERDYFQSTGYGGYPCL